MILSKKAGAKIRRQSSYPFSKYILLALEPVVALLLVASSIAAAGTLPEMPDRTYVTNGAVSAIVRVGDTIYIGGIFDRVGPPTGPGVELALDGTQNPGVPELTGSDGTVQTVASDGAGGWYVGGQFTHVGGILRNNIAHILADHSVDPSFDPNPDNYVSKIVVSGATVYVAGPFTQIGGQSRSFIAGLSVTDGAATAFNPGADADVHTIAVSSSGTTVYAGGNFATIGGQARQGVAALNATDGSATSFNPNPSGIAISIAISGSTLYVGGFFSTIGGQPRSNIAALTLGGALDGTATSFNPGANQGVYAIAVSPVDSTVFAAGGFTSIGGQSRHNVAGLDPTSGNATNFDPDPDTNPIILVVSSSGTVYAGGGFQTIGGQPRNSVAELNPADGSATAFNPNPNNTISAIGTSASAVYIGGLMTSIGGVKRRGIAALNAIDGTVTDFAPEAAGDQTDLVSVNALVVKDNTLYVGGRFLLMGGQPRQNIAALDFNGAALPNWNPGASDTVNSFALSGSVLYVGGVFATVGGQPRTNLAAVGTDDGIPTSFDAKCDGVVNTIVVAEPLVYVGGHFSSFGFGAQTRWAVAALNTSDGSATDWNAHMNHDGADGGMIVTSLAVVGSTVYVGGSFISAGGAARLNIAALKTGDAAAMDFTADANDVVFAIAATSTSVYVGGVFSEIGGKLRNVVAELDPVTGNATSFDAGAGPQYTASALSVQPNGALYIGGTFRSFDLGPQSGFASFFGGASNDVIFTDGFE